MNYINRPKECYTQEEWIKYLEESIRELRIEKDRIRKEKWEIRKEMLELERDLEHRDSFFSIMRDVLANEDIDNTELAAILYCVVHEECGDIDLSKKELEMAKKFWKREYA